MNHIKALILQLLAAIAALQKTESRNMGAIEGIRKDINTLTAGNEVFADPLVKQQLAAVFANAANQPASTANATAPTVGTIGQTGTDDTAGSAGTPPPAATPRPGSIPPPPEQVQQQDAPGSGTAAGDAGTTAPLEEPSGQLPPETEPEAEPQPDAAPPDPDAQPPKVDPADQAQAAT